MFDFNPAQGSAPALEWVRLEDLNIDAEYQRGLDTRSSQVMVRSIGRDWDWRLCQPLNVARRADDTLWVVDGQHRLAGARQRNDIPKLPCVIFDVRDRTEEAGTFINLNQRRKALNAVDVFKASITSGSPQSVEVMSIITDAGLTLAPHSNYTVWKPKMLYCVPGITSAYRRHGRSVTSAALVALAEAYPKDVLRYAGQMLRGLFIVYATEGKETGFDPDAFIERLSKNTQQQWMRKAHERIARTGENIGVALAGVMLAAFNR